jgi:hypothetical protein
MKPNQDSSGLVFFIHNHKCGGNSIKSALIASKTKFISTDQICIDAKSDLNDQILGGSSGHPILIFGHPDQIRRSKEQRKSLDFLSNLYSNAHIIFPSRRPISLMISWLEYTRTRLLKSSAGAAARYHRNKNNEAAMAELWALYSGQSFDVAQACGFPHPFPMAFDNVKRWIDVASANRIYHFIQSYNLFFPQSNKIRLAVKERKPFSLPVERLIETGRIFIYDSQNYSETATRYLVSIFGDDFMAELTQASLNSSAKSLDRLAAGELLSLEQSLDEISDFDSQIFRAAV